MLADRKRFFAVMTFLFVPALPTFAQQSPPWQGSPWQGPHSQQPASPAPLPQESRPSPVPQPPLLPETQPQGEGHPQVMEMPTAQPPSALSTQPALSPQQSATARSQGAPARPAYFGAIGKTALACRYPAGVRVSHVIEGSPAQRAGLQGEATLSWKEALAGLLALSPVAPLAAPFIIQSDHGGYGDLLLAVDGKRIHNHEEFTQEMERLRPGDVVYLSILREGSGLRQIPVQLTEYPDFSTAMVR